MAAPSTSPTHSRMSTTSPKGSKKNIPKTEEPVKVTTATAATTEPSIESKPAAANGPLAPPPKPQPASDAPDYFSQTHSSTNPFALEPNVFEASFGNPSVETPGRTVLPPVANIASPSPLPGITPGWSSSLRSGPLSPAMLSGPTNQGDYFSADFGRGFPTPNESSLRTGLTPGGGGSMFPVPSPNTQAIFNLQSGVATPSTVEFQASALRAQAQANQNKYPPTSAPTSQPEGATTMNQPNNFQPQHLQRGQNDHFANHDVSNAANDLLSFATQNGTTRNGAQPFSMTNHAPAVSNLGHMPVQPVDHQNQNSRHNTKGSINSAMSADTADSPDSGHSEQKSNTRSRARKPSVAPKQAAGSKRKAETTPKGGSRKKTTNGATPSLDGMDDSDEEPTSPKNEDGKKMTDEEKRKNFLERNRVAALKCRQRKKQWLQNLQNKVEIFGTENDQLTSTITQLREEIVNLKTVLLAHKDCPISVAQGINGINMNNFLGGDHQTHNPYGMAQMAPPNGMQMGMQMQPSQMQNRFVSPLPRPSRPEDGGILPFQMNQYLPQAS